MKCFNYAFLLVLLSLSGKDRRKMTKTLADKIRKKVNKRMDRSQQAKIQEQISLVESLDYSSLEALGYRPHAVNLEGARYIALDAGEVNSASNQTGRGDFRYLTQEGNVVGLAIHRSNAGGYRQII